jgi:hypothetical protein
MKKIYFFLITAFFTGLVVHTGATQERTKEETITPTLNVEELRKTGGEVDQEAAYEGPKPQQQTQNEYEAFKSLGLKIDLTRFYQGLLENLRNENKINECKVGCYENKCVNRDALSICSLNCDLERQQAIREEQLRGN